MGSWMQLGQFGHDKAVNLLMPFLRLILELFNNVFAQIISQEFPVSYGPTRNVISTKKDVTSAYFHQYIYIV